jgi:hypothetical protein
MTKETIFLLKSWLQEEKFPFCLEDSCMKEIVKELLQYKDLLEEINLIISDSKEFDVDLLKNKARLLKSDQQEYQKLKDKLSIVRGFFNQNESF